MWASFTAPRQQRDNDSDVRRTGPLHSNTKVRHRILIVDDDEAICDGFSRLLRMAGYTTTTAGSVSTAVDRAREGFDLMLLDLRLGNRSGLDVLRALAGARLHGPIVVVTGYGDVRSAVTAMKLGAVDYVTKPLSEEQLLRVVQDTLREWAPDVGEQATGPEEAHGAYGGHLLTKPAHDMRFGPRGC